MYQQDMNSSNFFQGFYDHKISNTLSVIFSTVGTLLLIPLLYGIIWYEKYGSNNKRTLLNKLVSAWCWASIEYLLLCQIPDNARHILGPMSQINCGIQMQLKLIVSVQLLLILDGIIFGRYFFIFWLKNPAAFNDDFWSLFLNIWIVMFSIISPISFFMVSSKQPALYYICIGNILDLDQNTPLTDTSSLFNFLIAFTVISHSVILLRKTVYKMKSKFLNNNSFNLGQSINFSLPIVKESLSDLTTSVCTSVMFFCSAIFVHVINKIPFSQLNCFPHYLGEYFVRLIWPITCLWILVLLHYYRNRKLRSALEMKILNHF
jgi:hypothetical protein